MTARVTGITLYRGDKFTKLMRFFEDTAKTQPQDVSDREYASQMRRGSEVIDLDIDMSEADEGRVTLTIDRETTADMAIGEWKWDVENTTTEVTLFRASVIAEGDVTRDEDA